MRAIHDVVPASFSEGQEPAAREYEYVATKDEEERIEALRESFGELDAPVIEERDKNGIPRYFQRMSLGESRFGGQRLLDLDFGHHPKSNENLPLEAKIIEPTNNGGRTEVSLNLVLASRMEGRQEGEEAPKDRPKIVTTEFGGEGTRVESFAEEEDFEAFDRLSQMLKPQREAA